MSSVKRSWLLCFGIAVLALIVGRWAWTNHRSPAPQQRELASHFVNGKVENLAKPDKYFEVKVEAVGGVPQNGEQELTLKGTVTLRQKINGEVSYRWLLPPEAQLVSGNPEDSWATLPVGQPTEIQITITGVSLENSSSVVILHVENEAADGIKIGNSAVFAPSPNTINLSVVGSKSVSVQSHADSTSNQDSKNSRQNVQF